MNESTPGGSETRKPGNYHVKVNGRWQIVTWYNNRWWPLWIQDPFYGEDGLITEIDERPIVRAAADTEEIMVDKELIEETCKVLLDFVHCSNETNADAWVCMKKLNDLIKP
jgi:hypothetical protein